MLVRLAVLYIPSRIDADDPFKRSYDIPLIEDLIYSASGAKRFGTSHGHPRSGRRDDIVALYSVIGR